MHIGETMLNQMRMFAKRLIRALGPVLITCIFLGAVYLLYKEINKYSIADIRMSLSHISTGSILLSLFLAIINYIILIGYDWLALKGIHKVLPLTKVSLVSFVGQAVSYNFGALLGGSTVRFRFYSSWNFLPIDIVRLVLMLAITFWVGAFGLVGGLFLIAPPDIPVELGMHIPIGPRLLGSILVLVAVGYLVVCWFMRKPVHILGKEFAFPPFHIAVAQLLVAGADLIAAGACLYVLLPPDSGVSFIEFLPSYLMSMVAVVLTHVPGGAGVLEVVILHLTTASSQNVLAALLCFRVIYYLLPLLLAAVVFAIYEIRLQAVQNSGSLHAVSRWMRLFAPTIMSFAVFAIGMLLCIFVVFPISGGVEEGQGSIATLLSNAARVLTALSGVLLLFLARGIQHRQQKSCIAVLCTIACGIVTISIYALHWGVVALLLLTAFCVWAVRSRCHRPSSIWKLHISLWQMAFICGTVLCSAGIGIALCHTVDMGLVCVLAAEIALMLGLSWRYRHTANMRASSKNFR